MMMPMTTRNLITLRHGGQSWTFWDEGTKTHTCLLEGMNDSKLQIPANDHDFEKDNVPKHNHHHDQPR